MKTRRALKGVPVLALALLLGAGPGGNQESDDFSFAKRLAYRGWFDLALEVCNRIERDTSLSRDVRSALPILLAEIELAKADREPDPEKALKLLSASIELLQKFIAGEPTHPRIFEAQINIGFLKSRKARALVDQVDVARDPAKHETLKKEAAALYAEVTADFEASVQNWRRLPPSEEISGAIMDARLEAERARFEHARIPGLPETDRRKLLEDAVKTLVDFEIDYGDTAKAFEAMLLEGRCLLELGEFAQAETKLKNTIGLKEILTKMKIPRNDYFDGIIFNAYLTQAQLYLKSARTKDAKNFIESTLQSDPSAARGWIGPALKVELVEAYFKLRQAADANKLAQSIIDADPDGPYGRRMRAKLNELGSSGGPRLAPDKAISAAEGSIEKGRIRDALGTLRQVVDGCVTEEDRNKYLARALYLMGQCLLDMRRHQEAAINFDKVYGQFPKHDLAPHAMWQAIVCFSEEFDAFENPADEKEKSRIMDLLIKSNPGHPVADNIFYLKGLERENARKPIEAADLYFQVPARAPAYERALVRGAYCLRFDAFQRWSAWLRDPKKDPAVQKAIRDQMEKAEKTFLDFLKRAADTTTKDADAKRERDSLVLVANQELAYIYSHDAVKKAPQGLAFLEKVSSGMEPDDDRMAKIHQLQITLHLSLAQNDESVKILEMMLSRFPNTRETAMACRSVGIRLDELTTEMIKKLGEGELTDVIKENLKKISRYYEKWLRGAMTFNLDATVNDVMSVADTLYMIAKRLNSIGDKTISFMDMKTRIVGYPQYFEDAEFVHSLLAGDRFKGKYPEKDRLTVMSRLARCQSFVASSQESWLNAKKSYEGIVRDYKVEDAERKFNSQALFGNPALVGIYLELGAVYKELGRSNKIHYDNAISVFANISSISQSDTEPWWISRFMIYETHFLRGKDKDILTAEVGIKQIEANYPDFDGNRYGLKEKFLELKRKISGR